MSTGSSRFAFDESFPEKDLELPENMRAELARPIGDMVSEESLMRTIAKSRKVVTVGDVVTVTLLRMNREPDVAVYDYKTRRSEEKGAKEQIARMAGKTVKVENPQGKITRALWKAVRDAVLSDERFKIEVSGEEDLAALVAIAHAPEGSHVIYGIPGQGITVVRVQEKTRKFAIDAITRMRR